MLSKSVNEWTSVWKIKFWRYLICSLLPILENTDRKLVPFHLSFNIRHCWIVKPNLLCNIVTGLKHARHASRSLIFFFLESVSWAHKEPVWKASWRVHDSNQSRTIESSGPPRRAKPGYYCAYQRGRAHQGSFVLSKKRTLKSLSARLKEASFSY